MKKVAYQLRPARKEALRSQANTHNANKGTAHGAQMIKDSLHNYGAGHSILLDKHGQIIAGNKTVEAAGAGGMKDLLVVQKQRNTAGGRPQNGPGP